MAAKKVKILYRDGREETIKVYADAQVMTEENFDGLDPKHAVAITYHFGWAALQLAGKVTTDFRTWLTTVDDVEDIDEPVDPTPEDPSDDTSSDSPS